MKTSVMLKRVYGVCWSVSVCIWPCTGWEVLEAISETIMTCVCEHDAMVAEHHTHGLIPTSSSAYAASVNRKGQSDRRALRSDAGALRSAHAQS